MAGPLDEGQRRPGRAVAVTKRFVDGQAVMPLPAANRGQRPATIRLLLFREFLDLLIAYFLGHGATQLGFSPHHPGCMMQTGWRRPGKVLPKFRHFVLDTNIRSVVFRSKADAHGNQNRSIVIIVLKRGRCQPRAFPRRRPDAAGSTFFRCAVRVGGCSLPVVLDDDPEAAP